MPSKRHYNHSDDSKSDESSSDSDSSSRHKRRRSESKYRHHHHHLHSERSHESDRYYEKERREDRKYDHEQNRKDKPIENKRHSNRNEEQHHHYNNERYYKESEKERNYYKEQKKSQFSSRPFGPTSLEEQKKKRIQMELDESVFQKVWEQIDTSNVASNWLDELLDELVSIQHKPPEVTLKPSKSNSSKSKSKSASDQQNSSDSNDSSTEDNSKIRDDSIGPKLVTTKEYQRGYGEDMMPGEGDAIAAFVQQNKRIPRRGEVGLTSDQIEQFEKAGYVMSGSRHRLMNAIRMRKENQVITEEQKKMMAKLKVEERLERENRILSEFREMAKKGGDK